VLVDARKKIIGSNYVKVALGGGGEDLVVKISVNVLLDKAHLVAN